MGEYSPCSCRVRGVYRQFRENRERDMRIVAEVATHSTSFHSPKSGSWGLEQEEEVDNYVIVLPARGRGGVGRRGDEAEVMRQRRGFSSGSISNRKERLRKVSRDGKYLVCEEGGGKHRLSEHDLGSLIELGY